MNFILEGQEAQLNAIKGQHAAQLGGIQGRVIH